MTLIPLVLLVLAAMAVVMTAGWLTQRGLNNGGWTDVFWTFGTGATCALAALVPAPGAPGPDRRQMLVAALVAIWAVRLGGYIVVRVGSSREDARYAELRKEWGGAFQTRMFGLLIVQAPATALLSLSILIAARTPNGPLGLRDGLGALVLLVAIAGEGVADHQMKRFKAGGPPHDAVCDTGLWGWSRHPNYFFEWLGWLAYPVIGLDPDRLGSWLTLASAVIMFLILRYLTGVPPLEAAMVRSKGEAYRRYQARVSPFLLLPPRGERA